MIRVITKSGTEYFFKSENNCWYFQRHPDGISCDFERYDGTWWPLYDFATATYVEKENNEWVSEWVSDKPNIFVPKGSKATKPLASASVKSETYIVRPEGVNPDIMVTPIVGKALILSFKSNMFPEDTLRTSLVTDVYYDTP